MKQSYENTTRSPFYVLLVLSVLGGVLGLLLSACSFPGSSSTTTTSNTTTTGVTPTTGPRRPLANPPDGTGKPSGGKPLPANEVKPLVFNLIYNDGAMESDVAQLYTPGSSSFHKFLSSNEILQHYALSDAQLQSVQDWLKQNGYTIVSTDSLRSAIQVTGTVAAIEHSLNIKLQSFTIAGHEFFMQDGDPRLPAAVGPLIQSIVGLDNFALPQIRPPFPFTVQSRTTLQSDCSSYGAKQTLTRNKLAGAYQINQLYQQGFQGQGMTIGVAEFGDTYAPSDIANYAACAGVGAPHIENIDVDGHLASGSGEGEAALDLELIAGLAPKAQILDYQTDSSTSFAQGMVDVFNRVATDHRVQVLSVSYGTAEEQLSATEQSAVNRSLRTLAAEGISVFISSGDCGAFGKRLHNTAIVSFPGSAPYAISVGGTHLVVNDANTRTSETAWGADDGAPVCMNEWGSGGGVTQNTDFQRPAWQVGDGTTNHYDGSQGKAGPVFTTGFPPQPVTAPNGLRQVPDVAAAAYPNIAVYYKSAWHASGGTSAAAPIWAAGALLVDQALKQNNKSFIGGVPEFYTLANHPGRFHPYTDITEGDNLFYPATSGWDYATGWGSPNFNDILQIELTE